MIKLTRSTTIIFAVSLLLGYSLWDYLLDFHLNLRYSQEINLAVILCVVYAYYRLFKSFQKKILGYNIKNVSFVAGFIISMVYGGFYELIRINKENTLKKDYIITLATVHHVNLIMPNQGTFEFQIGGKSFYGIYRGKKLSANDTLKIIYSKANPHLSEQYIKNEQIHKASDGLFYDSNDHLYSGVYSYYNEDSVLVVTFNVIDGKLDGFFRRYTSNSELFIEMNFLKNYAHGPCSFYYPEENKEILVNYYLGKVEEDYFIIDEKGDSIIHHDPQFTMRLDSVIYKLVE